MKRLCGLVTGVMMIALTGCASLTALGTQSGQADSSANDARSVSGNEGADISEYSFEQTEEEGTTEEETEGVPAEGIGFENPRVTVSKGDEFTLDVAVFPEDATLLKRITWSTLNPKVVLADSSGNLKATGGGTTLVLAHMGLLTAVCQVTVEAPLQGISLSDLELDCDRQTTYTLDMQLNPEDTTDEVSPVYASDNTSVVAVDPAGGLHTINPGTAHITVTVGEFEETCEVKVVAHLKKLSFDGKEISLDLGKSTQLSVALSPANTTDEPVLHFSSSAPSVVSVDQDGVVEALSAGSAQITVSAGNISAECTVSVNVPLEGIELVQKQMQLEKGGSGQLETALLPADTTEMPEISYGSSNPAVAVVDAEGLVTAVGAGTAVIFASAGTYSDSCDVRVTAPLQSVSLDKSDVTMWTGESTVLSVGYLPGDTTDDRTVIWVSSDPAVAAVNGGTVQAVSEGTCTITATAGGKSASCIVRVATFVHVAAVSLSEAQITLGSVGETRQLSASVAPANATSPTVTYSSSNAKVASVSSTGLVTAISGGTAVITATADGQAASCTVTVNLPQAQKVIVLDPGHGGSDPGAGYNGLVEKDLNLKVALYCKAYLEEHYSGMVVLLTRSSDVQLAHDETGTDLRARCEYAAGVGADVMVSLHFNSAPGHTSRGALALISKQPAVTAASAALANSILAQLQALGLQNRGALITESSTLFDANGAMDYYAINRICANYGIPGIIVEHCFMDNAADAAFCDSEADLQKLGAADAIGIAAYLGLAAK